ncbi:tRNA (uridine(34)/cytosine(34)/5-carboxymethylaminomethyluridine(34)-2'-O)-methyltransferase TrmL [Moraxella caviae]|uniref:tRNA (cytidine(34)-2'-O)-methyltransferase n=1 Tax=Moraxella caviae TaxID=34060 RepID=A0A1T0A7B4_9GAMM|nr:tRNA (cytidine(34)-2'-O)-methyltransferase [Moraxella caviae]OOR91560.1 tRNA (uridine(34)/cytosine(34)/5-carboxymethylaminomethyluridine(34)-2'-O)-methyltransferase TrmL [Moraxella caviae]STZ14397.1 tRNA (cytidine(34)-2'-O)-methyltransferase [Moraxella caviae]VEW10516.1 tRNA (cytidine(34)-2'-O)-methyltransferase [Moraxella caviae]
MIHIVLFSPKIPNNTGSIIRLCANTGARLHLVRPLGFELDDTKLKRAGLDYHEYADLQVHDDWQACRAALGELGVAVVAAMTTKFSRPFYEYDFVKQAAGGDVALVFGSETDGLPSDVRDDIGEQNWLRLPMLPQSRSLNLANSASICLYEVWRQFGFEGDVGESVGYHRLSSRPDE